MNPKGQAFPESNQALDTSPHLAMDPFSSFGIHAYIKTAWTHARGPNLAPDFNTDSAASPPHSESPPRVYSEHGGRGEREGEVVEGERVRENREESRRGGGEGR